MSQSPDDAPWHSDEDTAPGDLPWAALGLRVYARGLAATDLFVDLACGAKLTLLAPRSEAYQAVGHELEALLADPRLVEARFDLFEYTVVRGWIPADGDPEDVETLHGETVRVGAQRVIGRFGAASILRTLHAGALRIHVLDALVNPTDPARRRHLHLVRP